MGAAGGDALALAAGAGGAEEDEALLTADAAGDSDSTDAETACCCGEPLRLFAPALSVTWELKARRGSDELTTSEEQRGAPERPRRENQHGDGRDRRAQQAARVSPPFAPCTPFPLPPDCTMATAAV